MNIKHDAINPVASPTKATGRDLAETYHLGGAADATIIPDGHHKHAYDRDFTWDVQVDDKLSVSRAGIEFMKKANKLINGKLKYGRVISYEEAEKMMKEEEQRAAEAEKAAAESAKVIETIKIVDPPARIVDTQYAGVQVKSVIPEPVTVAQKDGSGVQCKVDVAFSGQFGRLKARYDYVIHQGINLVLIQKDGTGYDPPDTNGQPLGIEIPGKRLVCYPATRFTWLDGSQVDLFFIEDGK